MTMAKKKSVRERIIAEARKNLSDEDLREAFAYAPNHPLWIAVMQIAESFREACVIVATEPDLSEKETNASIGGVATMDDWIDELMVRAREAIEIRERIEAEVESGGNSGGA